MSGSISAMNIIIHIARQSLTSECMSQPVVGLLQSFALYPDRKESSLHTDANSEPEYIRVADYHDRRTCSTTVP